MMWLYDAGYPFSGKEIERSTSSYLLSLKGSLNLECRILFFKSTRLSVRIYVQSCKKVQECKYAKAYLML